MRHLILCLFILFSVSVFTQSDSSFSISCVSADGAESIRNVQLTVSQEGREWKLKTGRNGDVSFKLDLRKMVIVEAKHAYYDNVRMELSPDDFPNNMLPEKYSLKMSERIKVYNEVIAYAPGVPQIVFSSDKLHVADFEFLPNDELLLLLYPKNLKKESELGVLHDGEIVSRFETKENPVELIHDFRNNPHVVCEKGVYGVYREGNDVGLATIEKSYFMKYIFPIIDTSYSKFYFSTFNKYYPAFDYKIFDQLDSSYSNIIEVKDELMMELYRSEYKWVDVRTKLWAKEMENETGIDKEIWVGANYFTQSIYYKELYAPMFVKNDTILVFDYYKDKLFKFNLKGEKLDSIVLTHHYNPKKSGWQKNVMQDKKTGEIYAFFEKDGICSIGRIDCNTGEIPKRVELQHRYIDKVAVNGSLVYYVYRPYESIQKRFLYYSKLF